MDGGDSTENAADKDEDEAPPLSESETFPGVGLADAPILLLVYFHKAQRAELVELHRLAVTALERGFHDRKLILELQRRFEFLKVVYKYHCVAEDEVILIHSRTHTLIHTLQYFCLVTEKMLLRKVKINSFS